MDNGEKPVYHIRRGLTKREYFSIMLMQGLCSGRTEYEQPGAEAEEAVRLADHLLEELEKEINI